MGDEDSPYLRRLRGRINLAQIPFSERGSRLLVFRGEDHLFVRLAERWFKLSNQLSAYRQRPPIVDRWQFTDGAGQPLPFTLTTHPHRLDLATAAGTFTLTFLDGETLLVALPAGPCGLAFEARMDQATADRRGGTLHLIGDIRRNVAYTTNARVIENSIEPHDGDAQRVRLRLEARAGDALLLNITPRLGFNRYVPEPAGVLQAAAERWHAWFAAAPPPPEAYADQYYFAWWVMRAGLISTRFFITREAMTPSKIHYVGVWQWDAFFHALAYRHVEPRLAQDQLRILLDHQRPDGMLPDAVHDEGTVTHLAFPIEADVTKPPLLAWTAWKLYQTTGDREFLDEIYEPVMRWNTWWYEKNDLDGNGLPEYQHPFSSGLDDSPLWDEGMPVEAPDLNTYLCLQQEALGKMAGVLGLPAEAEQWAQRAEAQAQRMLALMWDEPAGLFLARRRGQPVAVRTPFNLLPLLTGRLPAAVNARLVAHLTNPREFWTRYPVPSVALDDPKFDPLQMWRGPTWANVNYLLIDGLQRCGYADVARELRTRTLDLLNGQPDFHEYYHPETGLPPPKSASLFGWSAAVFIDLALQAAREAAPPSAA